MPKEFNALTLHNWFSNLYRKTFGVPYDAKGKGLELIQLKKLLQIYTAYQIMRAMEIAISDAVFINIKEFTYNSSSLIEESASDPLLAKAYFAMKMAKGELKKRIYKAYYEYCDEVDAWFSDKHKVDKAADYLEELSDELL